MTPSELRALVPATQRFAWLNAAASSPLPTPVADAMTSLIREGVAQADLRVSTWLAIRDATRASLASLINAAPEEVAFTPSSSAGMTIVARLLREHGVEEVATLEGEFPSTTVPLLHGGLALRAVKRRPDGTFSVADLEASLSPKTKAVAVSAVQFASGFRIDLPALSSLCRSRGLILCLNAAQALGQVPIDFSGWGASFLVAPTHKWLMAGWGLATLVISRGWLERGPLPQAGWLSVPPELLWQTFPGSQHTEETTTSTLVRGAAVRSEASALEVGGFPIINLAALQAALSLVRAVGPATILAHNQRLQRLLRAGLRKRGFTPNTPDDDASLSGICVVPVKGDPLEAVRALLTRDVATTPRGGGLRLSTHAYNDEGDLHRTLEAIDTLRIQPP